jgi:hypothetical protein
MLYVKIMYVEAKELPNILDSTTAFSMFRNTIGKLLEVIFCDFFF